MNKKQILLAGPIALLIAGCCTFDPAQDETPAGPPQIKESVQVFGFDKPGFTGFLAEHDQSLYRIQEYNEGAKVGDPIGTLQDVACNLEDKIEFWVTHHGGKTKGGATKYTGQLGASCSTSCKPNVIQNSTALADAFRAKYGPPLPAPKRHNHRPQ